MAKVRKRQLAKARTKRNSAWVTNTQKKNRKAIRQERQELNKIRNENRKVDKEFNRILNNKNRLQYDKLEEHIYKAQEIASTKDPTFDKALLREKKLAVREYENYKKILDPNNQSRKTFEANLGYKLTNEEYLSIINLSDSDVWEQIQELADVDSDILVDLFETEMSYEEMYDTLKNFLDDYVETEDNDVSRETLLNYVLQVAYESED